MALELEYTVKKTGVVGNYWRIVGYDAQKNNIHKITFVADSVIDTSDPCCTPEEL